MRQTVSPHPPGRTRALVWLGTGLGLLLLLGANGHLLYVAISSQPDCVAHERQGDPARRSFTAASSSCSPAAPSTLE